KRRRRGDVDPGGQRRARGTGLVRDYAGGRADPGDRGRADQRRPDRGGPGQAPVSRSAGSPVVTFAGGIRFLVVWDEAADHEEQTMTTTVLAIGGAGRLGRRLVPQPPEAAFDELLAEAVREGGDR